MRFRIVRLLFFLPGIIFFPASATEMPGFPWVKVYAEAGLFEKSSAFPHITQSEDAMFLGDSRGLYTFDGNSWKFLDIPGVREVLSLTSDIDGRIVVGTHEQIGYLRPDQKGQLQFISLREFLPPSFVETRQFFTPVAGHDGVYFISFHVVFRWDRAGHIEAWSTGDIFPYLIQVKDEVFISDADRGLFRVRGSKLEPVPGCNPRPGVPPDRAQKVTGAAPFRNGWLMTTASDGFRFFDGQALQTIELPATAAVKSLQQDVIDIKEINGERLAVLDEHSHLIVLDSHGDIVARWGPREFPGLLTSGLFVDREKNIWMPLRTGLLKLDLNKSIRVLDERALWDEPPQHVYVDGQRRIFQTDGGVVEWIQGSYPGSGSLQPIKGVAAVLGVFDGDLMYLPHGERIVYCRYKDGRVEKVEGQTESENNWTMIQSWHDPDLIYATQAQRILSIKKNQGHWRIYQSPSSLPATFTDVTEGDFHLWITLGQGRVARVNREPFLHHLTIFNQANGLPDLWVRAFNLGHEVLFATSTGIYSFNEATLTFREDPRFASIPAANAKELLTEEMDPQGNIWIGSSSGQGILRKQPNGSYIWDGTSLSALESLSIRRMSWDPAGWMWCYTQTGIMAVKSEGDPIPKNHFHTRVREVRDLRNDNPICGPSYGSTPRPQNLSYGQNSLQIEIAAPEYTAPMGVEFQFELEGNESRWTPWQKSPIKRYPSLSEGHYVLHFRARNGRGEMATGEPFEFSIAAPPYRTLGAYLTYAAFIGLLGWGCAHLYSGRLRRDNAKLEKLIGERTRQLDQVHKELVEASRLSGMAEVATDVIHNVGNVLNSVNISASLIAENLRRTESSPLSKVSTLFATHEANLADFFATDPKSKFVPAFLQAAVKTERENREHLNSECARLLEQINHIKEIVAMQQAHANVRLALEALDPISLMEDALKLNSGSLIRHGLVVERQYIEVPRVLAQRGKVIQILVNLILNAEQACQESGRADPKITLKTAHGTGGRVRLSVQDNGVGIPVENRTRIFNHGFTTRKTGHGFGLHSAANAATEMKGSLTVESDGINKGATFTLELSAVQTNAPLL